MVTRRDAKKRVKKLVQHFKKKYGLSYKSIGALCGVSDGMLSRIFGNGSCFVPTNTITSLYRRLQLLEQNLLNLSIEINKDTKYERPNEEEEYTEEDVMLAELSSINKILNSVTDEDVIDKFSLLDRKDKIKKELSLLAKDNIGVEDE